jgi:hypothetical protein
MDLGLCDFHLCIRYIVVVDSRESCTTLSKGNNRPFYWPCFVKFADRYYAHTNRNEGIIGAVHFDARAACGQKFAYNRYTWEMEVRASVSTGRITVPLDRFHATARVMLLASRFRSRQHGLTTEHHETLVR